VADAALDLILFEVFGAEFQSDWSSSYLPVVEFKAWVVVVTVVDYTSDSNSFELLEQLLCPTEDSFVVFVFIEDWDDHHLGLCNSWGDNNSGVVTVDHDHGTDTSGGQAP